MPTSTSKQIGSFTFQFTQLPAWENLFAFHGFLKLLGPAAPGVMKAFSEALKRGSSEKADWGPVAVGLLGTLPQTLAVSNFTDLETLARALLKNVLVSGQVVDGKQRSGPVLDVFDAMLQGQLMTTLELISWCIQEAFGGFFAEAMAKLSARKQADSSPKATPSP